MPKPILSLPIDPKLDRAIKADMKSQHLSRADIVRQILLRYYGLLTRYGH